VSLWRFFVRRLISTSNIKKDSICPAKLFDGSLAVALLQPATPRFFCVTLFA
jgi:hypothetical protein